MKTVDIESFIRWASNEEWPKAQPPEPDSPNGYSPAWDRVGAWRVGGVNAFGVVSVVDAIDREVHRDAVALHEALVMIDDFPIDCPEGWNPLGGVSATACDGATISDCDRALNARLKQALDVVTVLDRGGVRKVKGSARALVLREAGRKRPRDLACEAIEVRAVGERGMPKWFVRETMIGAADGLPYDIEVDGYDRKRKRPKAGAYRKYVCEPDPLETIVARAEHEVAWHALRILVELLDGKTVAHRVVMSPRALRPWEEGDAPGSCSPKGGSQHREPRVLKVAA